MRQHVKAAAMAVAICSILVASVYAVERTREFTVKLPGLDKYGNLDHRLGGHAKAKLVVDTRAREFCIRAYPVVTNLSRKKHTFYDVHTPSLLALARRLGINPSRIRITKDIYYVDEPKLLDRHKKANARAVCCGELRRVS